MYAAEEIAPDVKAKAYALKEAADCASVKSAVEKLAYERDHRNISPLMQYAYKNLASIGGNQCIPAADTMLKGARIRTYLDNVLKVKHTDGTFYGIAYGHMVESVKAPNLSLKLVDISPAKHAAHMIEIGNIYKIDKDLKIPDKPYLVIDDTMTEGKIGKKEKDSLLRSDIQVVEGMSGDLNKINKFTKFVDSPITIVSKVSMANYDEATWKNLLFPDSKLGKKYRHVALYKFGKLHNNEAFLVLSNHPSVSETRWPQFQYHVLSVMICMSMANRVLQKNADWAVPVGVIPRLDMDKLWLGVVKHLPTKWTWYEEVYNSRVTYGSTVIGNTADYDMFDSLEDVWLDEVKDVAPVDTA